MLAIIGGTGLYQLEAVKVIEELQLSTPYGAHSGPITRAEYQGRKLLFLPRHGATHSLMPHEVNYRANIWALKRLGALQVIGVSAVGSLQAEIKPGDFSVPSGYFDFVKGPREKSFFGEGLVAHVSTAKTTCPALTRAIADCATELDLTLHLNTSYAGVDGPRLGTKVESIFLKEQARCHLVGMTNVPEAFLAREAQLCYATLCAVTDYDCWMEDETQHVSVADVIARYRESIERAKALLELMLTRPAPPIDPIHREVLRASLLTPKESLNEKKRALFELLSR